MGDRGKLSERAEARRLRALGWTMPDIARQLHVSRSSVSLWTGDVPVEPGPRRPLRPRQPNASERRKAAELADLLDKGGGHRPALRARPADRGHRPLCRRRQQDRPRGRIRQYRSADGQPVLRVAPPFFDIDQRRLRARLYLHEGLDLEAATYFWSTVIDIPLQQFRAAYRAKDDPTRRLRNTSTDAFR